MPDLRRPLSRARRRAVDTLGDVGDWARELPSETVDLVDARIDRLAHRLVRYPSQVTSPAELTDSLRAARSSTSLGSITSALTGSKIARRAIGLGSRRIPALAAITGTATALTAFAGGFRELRLLGSYLVNRAHAQGIEVDPGRLRTVTLQVYLRPDTIPNLDDPPRLLVTRVAAVWARGAAARALPLVPDDLGRPAVRRWVKAADLLDVSLIAAPEGLSERSSDRR